MSSPDMFLSSPLRASRRSVYVIPTSSPDLPSMQDMLSQKPKRSAIRSGSKAVPIPDDANSTFTSARELWKSAQSAEVNQPCVSAPSDKALLLDDIDTPNRISDGASREDLLMRSPRRSETGIDTSRPEVDQQGDPEEALSQPWRKYKPRTPEKETSPRAHASAEKDILNAAPKHRGIEIGSRGTTPSRNPPFPRAEGDMRWDPKEPLLLEPAMIRRKDWTPPTKNSVITLDSDASATGQDVFGLDEDDSTKSFGSILSAYKCDEANAANQSDGSTTKKRKLAPQRSEPVAISTTSAKPVKKPRAPPKKARTITALATAAYRQPTEIEPTKGSQDETAPVHAKPLNQTSKKAKPRKRPSKAKKKPEPAKPVLYSPETALKQVAKQDFVFGTSSQLATEHSPTFLRGLQEAMKDSNQLDYIDFTTPLNSDAVEPPEARPRLWDAAARDVDGDLFDVEVVNLTEASPQPRTSGDVDPYGYFKVDDTPGLPNKTRPVKSDKKSDDFFVDISDIFPNRNSTLRHSAGKGTNDPTGTDLDLQQASKPALDTVVTGSQTAREETTTNQNTNQLSRPSFEMYTDAQLSKEVSQYGFKPIKRRSAMIALLDQCWQQRGGGSQQRQMRLASTAATSPAKRPRGRPRKNSVDISQLQEPPPSAQAPETPKRPRGRPRKDSHATPGKLAVSKRNITPPRQRMGKNKATPKKAGKASVIEIPDSESEPAEPLGSSPNSSPSSTFSSPHNGDLTMSVTEDTELSLAITPTGSQSELFTHITKAITSAPRTTDPLNPSWHEKILLYDPVVLEDLTSWLNSGQLSRVGYDGETNPVDLKKWCESKSICCLWKVNLRGKERKRY